MLAAQGTIPQLDILSAKLLLSADGQTLRSIITVRNLSTTIPTGGVENDYQLVWSYGGTQYFTQLAVEPGGVINAYDGELLRLSLENRYQQLHVDTGSITAGAERHRRRSTSRSRTCRASSPGAALAAPSAATYVREGVVGRLARARRRRRPHQRLRGRRLLTMKRALSIGVGLVAVLAVVASSGGTRQQHRRCYAVLHCRSRFAASPRCAPICRSCTTRPLRTTASVRRTCSLRTTSRRRLRAAAAIRPSRSSMPTTTRRSSRT